MAVVLSGLLMKRDHRSEAAVVLCSVENFGKEYTSLPAHDSPGTSPHTRHRGDNDPFKNFSYIAPGFLSSLEDTN